MPPLSWNDLIRISEAFENTGYSIPERVRSRCDCSASARMNWRMTKRDSGGSELREKLEGWIVSSHPTRCEDRVVVRNTPDFLRAPLEG